MCDSIYVCRWILFLFVQNAKIIKQHHSFNSIYYKHDVYLITWWSQFGAFFLEEIQLFLSMTMPMIKPDNLILYIHYIHYIHQNLRKSFVSSLKKNCLLCSVFSKRWLVYAAGTNTDVCARNYLYPVLLLTKTQPRDFYQWIFIKDTPLPDWQDDQAQELGHAVYWVHL